MYPLRPHVERLDSHGYAMSVCTHLLCCIGCDTLVAVGGTYKTRVLL
eukprot:COSAG01_NODE_53297_length_340_cov_0.846473_1_plen_46_part_10